MKNEIKRYSAIFCLLGFLFYGSAFGQLNPCNGDKIGIRSGEGTVQIPRQTCEQIVISYDKYFALEVAARQNDSLRAKSLRYMSVVENNIALRDSIDHLNRSFIGTQDTTIERYKRIIEGYQQTSRDAIDNAKYCERRLTLAKLKTGLFAIGGAVGGAILGLLVGNGLSN